MLLCTDDYGSTKKSRIRNYWKQQLRPVGKLEIGINQENSDVEAHL